MKFQLLNIAKISLFLTVIAYLTANFTFGKKGIIEYYKLEKRFQENKISYNFLLSENRKLSTKLSLLNEKEVNLLYLEEMARTSLQLVKVNEKVIILEE